MEVFISLASKSLCGMKAPGFQNRDLCTENQIFCITHITLASSLMCRQCFFTCLQYWTWSMDSQYHPILVWGKLLRLRAKLFIFAIQIFEKIFQISNLPLSLISSYRLQSVIFKNNFMWFLLFCCLAYTEACFKTSLLFLSIFVRWSSQMFVLCDKTQQLLYRNIPDFIDYNIKQW